MIRGVQVAAARIGGHASHSCARREGRALYRAKIAGSAVERESGNQPLVRIRYVNEIAGGRDRQIVRARICHITVDQRYGSAARIKREYLQVVAVEVGCDQKV